MGSTKTSGFTIIEVMLFLGVTGIMVVGILAGYGVAIGQQRYRDSVNMVKSFIQQQYNETANVVNTRPGDESCTNAVVTAPPTAVSNPQPRGTSDCLIVGRFLTVDESGKVMTVANVVGFRERNAPQASTDLEDMQRNYRFGVSADSQETKQVEWDSRIVEPKTTNGYPVSLLIIRSPVSGVTMTFTQNGVQSNLSEMINRGIASTNKDLCIDAPAGSFVGSRLAVRIAGYATNQSGVEIPSEGEAICD